MTLQKILRKLRSSTSTDRGLVVFHFIQAVTTLQEKCDFFHVSGYSFRFVQKPFLSSSRKKKNLTHGVVVQ